LAKLTKNPGPRRFLKAQQNKKSIPELKGYND
jgi:hypothetical protein